MTELLIFDRHDELLAILSNDSEQACPFWDAPFKEVLNNGTYFEFSAPADHGDSQYIVAENQVAFLDKDENFRLFIIKEPERTNGEQGPQIRVICEPASLELADEPIEDVRVYGHTLNTALTRALDGTRWQVGETADLGINSTNYYYTNVIEAVQKILNTWGGEVRDRVEINGNKITGRFIDILPRRGADTGKLWEIDKDILSISQKVQSYPKTALYGRGASLEIQDEEGNHAGGYTRKINFSSVKWEKAKGDPVDKPYGQEWVGDPTALSVYGRKNYDGTLRHRYGFFDSSEQEDPAKLLQETWDALQQQKHPIRNYAMDVFLLEEISGHEHEKVRLGDTTIAIDRSFANPIEIAERVVVYEYDVADPDNTGHVELGQYIDTYRDDKRLDNLEAKLNDRSAIWDKADSPVTDDSIEDIEPGKVTGVIASGAVRTIMLEWDYVNQIYLASYEVYASQVKGFSPAPANLVFRGKTSSYVFEANTDEVWYFRVRSVNTHGRAGEYSDEVQGNTVRIISDDILFGPDIAAELEELSKTTEILSKEAKDKITAPAFSYTDGKVAVEEEARKLADALAKQESAADAKVKADAALEQAKLDAKGKADAAEAAAKAQSAIDAADAKAEAIRQAGLDATSKIEKLEIGGNNLVPHASKHWEQGSRSPSTGGKIVSNARIRQKTFNVISPNTAYILSAGNEFTNVGLLYLFRSDGSFTRCFNFGYGNNNTSIAFITNDDETQYILAMGHVFESVFPIDAGSRLKIKLERGKVKTDWTPSPEDVDEAIAEVSGKLTTAEASIQTLAGQIITKAESSTVVALGARVSTAEQNIDGLSGVITQKVSQTDFNSLSGRVSAAETSITQQAGQIKSKAESSTVTAISNRIIKAEQNISALDGAITQKVSQTEFDKVTGRVNAAETAITQQAGKIASKAETTAVNALGTRVTSAEQSINGLSGAIAQKVSQTAFDSVANRMTAAETAITQQSDRIDSKASTTSVSSLGTRMTTAEQSINGLSGEISQRVKTTDYTGNTIASLINQTATSIKLKASKIELTGDVSILNGITKIADLAVGNAQIAAGAITAAKIANATITSAEIASAAITSAKIGSAAIGTAAIANGAITRAKIGTAAIGSAQIENASITNSLIAANADIDAGKIGNLSADKIKTGTLTGIKIQSPASAGGLILIQEGQILNFWSSSLIRMSTLLRNGNKQSMLLFDSATASAEILLSGQGLELWSNNAPIMLSARTFMNSGYVWGDFSVIGTKNAAVPTSMGMVNVSAYETAEYYFGDIGRGEVTNGECIVHIEPLFAETVNTNIDYEVFLTPYGKGLIYVDEMTPGYFVVKGDDISFAYEIKAKRRNYEDVRLEATHESGGISNAV